MPGLCDNIYSVTHDPLCKPANAVDPINEYVPKISLIPLDIIMDKLWISADIPLMPSDIINGAVDIYGHVQATINGHLWTWLGHH